MSHSAFDGVSVYQPGDLGSVAQCAQVTLVSGMLVQFAAGFWMKETSRVRLEQAANTK